ncbi:MAG: AMP-binding protein [Planctomycetota bacterium]|nr:AMP-binding protein [Planctomycetota bacterium]
MDVGATLDLIRRTGLLDPTRTAALTGGLVRWGPSLAAGVAAGALRLRNRTAVIDDLGSCTWGQLDHRTSTQARGLRARGVGRGTQVGILCRNHRGFVEASVVAAKAGLVPVYLNTGSAAAQLVEVVERESLGLVIGDPELVADLPADAVPGPVIAIGPEWDAVAKQGSRRLDLLPPSSVAPVLMTSGTTGVPKGVLRDNGGHAVALHWTMKHLYGVEPGEVFWAASDVGWVVGHSYIVYGPLLHGNTTVLFEGKPVGTPDAGTFWRVAADHRVAAMFTAPTAFRAIKQHDPQGTLLDDYDLSAMRALFLAGERCDPATLAWAEEKLGIPVIDHWWQTETGWAIAANCIGIEHLAVKPGSAGPATPGWDVCVVDEGGQEVPAGQMGDIVCRLPMPPGAFPTLWHAPDKYVSTYMEHFPGFYETSDAGYMDEDGYVFVMARTDDIINVAGHRLSTGGMEEALIAHPDVAECAVIGAADPLKGQLPLGFLVLNAGVDRDTDEIVKECIARVRTAIGPVAAFKQAIVVERLPKTRSGKIVRRTICRIADGEEYAVPATIEDPATLTEIAAALKALGYPR